MSALLLGLLLATQPVSPTPAAAPTAEMPTTTAPTTATPTTTETPTTAATPTADPATTETVDERDVQPTAPPVKPEVPSMRGPVGVGLLAVGATLAAGGTVAFTLVEAVSTPDRRSNPPSATVERFTTISGFLGVAVASVSAVLVVIGAGLTLADSGDGAVPPA